MVKKELGRLAADVDINLLEAVNAVCGAIKCQKNGFVEQCCYRGLEEYLRTGSFLLTEDRRVVSQILEKLNGEL